MKALLVDRARLLEAQDRNRIIDAEEVIRAAWTADVKPVLEVARMKAGLDPDPLGAYRKSGYYERTLKERSEAGKKPAKPGVLKGSGS